MNIRKGIGKRRIDEGGVGSDRRNRGRVGGRHVWAFETESLLVGSQ